MILTNQNDTITAIATSYGIGSIAIIRISGSNALQTVKELTNKNSFSPRVATLCNIHDKLNTPIDQAIIIYFKAPYSFTGEDIVEIQSHGGITVANMILKEILKYNVRLATAGEFSKRAFLNNKIDLTQAEAISQIIEAKSEDAIKILNRILNGNLKNYINNIRTDIIELIAYIEVSIDYAEEDLPTNILDSIKDKIDSTILILEKALKSSQNRDSLLNGFKLSLVGKPNVGKSSLLNSLLDYDRAIVSDIAGTTRDTIEESLQLGTHLVKIIDTAGIRATSNEIEKIGIERSMLAIDDSDIILAIFDGSNILDKEDKKIIELLEKSKKNIIIIINKIDLNQKIHENSFNFENIIKLSANQNVDNLIELLKNILNNSSNYDDTMLVSARQESAVKDTLTALQESKKFILNGEYEFLSYELNSAVTSISSISRPYEYDQMLDVMFGEFCLGK